MHGRSPMMNLEKLGTVGAMHLDAVPTGPDCGHTKRQFMPSDACLESKSGKLALM